MITINHSNSMKYDNVIKIFNSIYEYFLKKRSKYYIMINVTEIAYDDLIKLLEEHVLKNALVESCGCIIIISFLVESDMRRMMMVFENTTTGEIINIKNEKV